MTHSLLFYLHVAILTTTAMYNLFSADPRNFIRKSIERVRQSRRFRPGFRVRAFGCLPEQPVSEARSLIDDGHLSAGVRSVAEQGNRAGTSDIHLAKRTLEKLFQLEQRPVKGKPLAPQRNPRILHVLTNSRPYTNSGYTVRTQHVLKAQQEAGIDVRGLTRLGYPVVVGRMPTTETQTIHGIPYSRMLPWRYPSRIDMRDKRAVSMIVDEAIRFRATVLQTTTDYTNAIVVSEAARILGIPWIYEVRGELESTWLSRKPEHEQEVAQSSEFYRLARAQETMCMCSASAVIALSEVSKRQMIERGVPPDSITVIPNAVDEDLIGRKFDPAAVRRELGLPIEKKLVGSVTAIVDYEGLDTLLEALATLPTDWEALIVGEGVSRPSLEARAKALGLERRAHFVGRKPSDDIWKWYAALDVFAVPRRDTRVTRTVTPIKPLIAMALGVPVVASDLPALREVTGERGTYFNATDNVASDLASAIRKAESHERKLVNSKNNLNTWGKNGDLYKGLICGRREGEGSNSV